MCCQIKYLIAYFCIINPKFKLILSVGHLVELSDTGYLTALFHLNALFDGTEGYKIVCS
jgi:hypothetical protein